MYRLKIDDITHKILGYEKENEYLTRYQEDVMVADVTLSDIGCYYENGNIMREEREDYHSEVRKLQEKLREQKIKFVNETERVVNALLEDTLDEVREEIKQAKTKAEEITKQINALEQEHKKELSEYYVKRNKEVDDAVSPRYYSSVCLLIKNENEYLEEWVKHYLALGFEQLYLYDNGSEVPVREAISNVSQEVRDKITVIEFTGEYDDLQTDCYNHYLDQYGSQTRWVAFLDSDEFLRFSDPSIKTVNEFLKEREQYTSIHVDFIEYGADAQEKFEEKPVRERFQKPVPVNDGIYYKDFLQPNRIDKMQTHYAVFDPEKHQTMKKDKRVVVIDHYYTKSWEEWLKKMERGSCDPNYLKRKNEFFVYNPEMGYLNDGEDEIQGYHGRVKYSTKERRQRWKRQNWYQN